MKELREKQKIFLMNITLLIQYAFRTGFELTSGEFFRSNETQAAHVAAGRSKTMNSMHLKRLAADLNIFIDGRLLFSDTAKIDSDLLLAKKLGDFWCSLNTANRWGADWDKDGNPINGNFPDPNHFEMQG